MSPPASLIATIADTARWVAWYRALESERPDAHFHDPYARLLAGQRGQDIVRSLPWSTWFSWAVVVRTCVFDELIRHLVEQEGVDLVLNLGAGFDTRPYRLTLPTRPRWIEVDLPAVLADKEEKLAHIPSVCALERVKLDLTESEARNALFRCLNAEARQVLVITEGLLLYLPSEQVSTLTRDLHALPQFRWWLTDQIAPTVLLVEQLIWNSYLAAGNSRMQFAPTEGEQFFAKHGWHIVECRSALEEAARLQCEMPFGWLFRWMVSFYPGVLQDMYRHLITYLLLHHA